MHHVIIVIDCFSCPRRSLISFWKQVQLEVFSRALLSYEICKLIEFVCDGTILTFILFLLVLGRVLGRLSFFDLDLFDLLICLRVWFPGNRERFAFSCIDVSSQMRSCRDCQALVSCSVRRGCGALVGWIWLILTRMDQFNLFGARLLSSLWVEELD